MGSTVVLSSKSRCRARFRTYRRSLPPTSRQARSALITHRALGHRAVATGTTVHVYWPLYERGEIDTRPLIAALRGRGATVVLPVVTSFAPNAPTMDHRRYEGPGCLTTNRWGIREPQNTARIAPEALDVVIVPAIGAGRDGHRIGQGGGYYDAFLDAVNAPRIGLAYEACLLPRVPSAPHDIRLTTIITERTSLTIA
ncbi:MAG: 5-formyltetrahydrofolate cyclo-ligase [Salinibacter sp.]